MSDDFVQVRTLMVEEQLIKRSIDNKRVLAAMEVIPRHQFVDDTLWPYAYEDRPLPIGFNQTISQPYIVAFMTQALQLPPQATVLEVGTGSGYQAAILSQVAAKVFTVERIASLAQQAQSAWHRLNITNIQWHIADGGYGWLDNGPYDGIIVTAAAPEIPPPLTAQLKNGARLIAPVGSRKSQDLICVQRQDHRLIEEKLAPVSFVPLLGEHGWAEN
jgi:protein-L-isoaspartate(D-aspartate) O-methyltransferase